MNTTRLARRAITVILTLLVGAAPLHAAPWKAGVARVKITPTEPMWMSGYGDRDHPSEGTLADLWAKALVIEDSAGARCVVVTLDLVGIDRGISTRICRQLTEKYNLPRARIMLSTSHTHTGPVVGDNLRAMYFYDEAQAEKIRTYTARLEGQIVEVVGAAMKSLAPATLSHGMGRATFAVNRRENREPDVAVLRAAGQLKGPSDYEAPVLAVRKASGELLAVVANYACHSTVLSFYQWSGDWPGFFQAEWERRHPGAQAMFVAGCGADQNPLPRRKVELAESYGRQLADAVDLALQGVLPTIDDAVTAEYREIDLPFDKLPTREELEHNLKSPNRYVVGHAKHLLAAWQRDGKLSSTYPYPVQTWRLGQGPTLIVLGGEVVVDYALRLKAELGPRDIWVASYANDVMAYIPSRRVRLEGGYEGVGAMLYYGLPGAWRVDVEELIIAEARRQASVVRAVAPPSTTGEVSAPPAYADHRQLMNYRDDQGAEHAVSSPRDWDVRRRHILAGMQQAMGSLPDRRHLEPLDIRETAREKLDGCTRVAITFIAEPGDRVPADLYLPADLAVGERRPAILALHQTHPLGKRNTAGEGGNPHMAYAIELARRGYVVLAPDYPSFGDYTYDFAAGRHASGTIKGIWNHLRCVDLLQSRDDVDPGRIGVIGHSLGGHNALFLAAFDERVSACVTSCGWTPFHDYYGGKIAGWTSARYMPWLKTVYGLDPNRSPFDFGEVLAAIAPRRVLSVSPTRDDNFAVAGVRRAEPEIRRVFALLGAKDHLVVRYPDTAHDFPDAERQAAYEFLDQALEFKPSRGK